MCWVQNISILKKHCVPLTSPSRSGMCWKCCGSDPGRAQSWDGQPSNARDRWRAVGSHVKLFELWDCLQCQGMSKKIMGLIWPNFCSLLGFSYCSYHVHSTCSDGSNMDAISDGYHEIQPRTCCWKTYLQLCGCQEPNYNYISPSISNIQLVAS